MPVLFAIGTTFLENELLWAVYPTYTEKPHDALEVLDFDLIDGLSDTTGVPSKVPMTRDDVMKLPDVHDFRRVTSPVTTN